MTIARISVTLPRDLAKAIDVRARELDRSRSWVIAEAARRFLGADWRIGGSADGGAKASNVAETQQSYVVTQGLGESRLQQLESDLRLTPAQRVRAAEDTARVGRLVSEPRQRPNQVLSFERYEDYLDWKRREAIQP